MIISVAGAGHGGLTAAARLAKAGHSVTVYEKREREELGHDWEDRFTFSVLLDAVDADKLPENSWRYRGDCAFVSPSYNTNVIINYTQETRQKIMWRKPVINMLLDYAQDCGVKLKFSSEVIAPLVEGRKVVGLLTSDGEVKSDLVIDAAGVFSPVRTKLPDCLGIEKQPVRGDVFYAWRGYFDRKPGYQTPAVPFEVYLYHAGEQGLSWCCTNDDSVDILIGRIDPLTDEQLNRHIEVFRKRHPWTGERLLHGGDFGIIPVRRPLSLMVADGYAAVGDSAFMTTPMNGMGIDLSLQAGKLLADTVIFSGNATVSSLWHYNREFHRLYGADTAKNEGLKNSLLQLPAEGVDFLFDNAVIQSADLAGAGRNTSPVSLLGKLVRGMKKPPYFFAILGGLMKGAKLSKALKNAPLEYNREAVSKWQDEVAGKVLKITR